MNPSHLRTLAAVLLLCCQGLPALAADTTEPARPAARPAEAKPDPLAPARKLVADKNFPAALDALLPVRDNSNPDWHNLIGYVLRNLPAPDYAIAEVHYREALRLAPQHRGALEYLGELYLQTGRRTQAEILLNNLAKACPTGCPELDDLKAAFARTPASR